MIALRLAYRETADFESTFGAGSELRPKFSGNSKDDLSNLLAYRFALQRDPFLPAQNELRDRRWR